MHSTQCTLCNALYAMHSTHMQCLASSDGQTNIIRQSSETIISSSSNHHRIIPTSLQSSPGVPWSSPAVPWSALGVPWSSLGVPEVPLEFPWSSPGVPLEFPGVHLDRHSVAIWAQAGACSSCRRLFLGVLASGRCRAPPFGFLARRACSFQPWLVLLLVGRQSSMLVPRSSA